MLVALMLLAFGFGGIKNTDGVMTMNTTAQEVSFELRGSGVVTVDWGDGSEKETVELAGDGETVCLYVPAGSLEAYKSTDGWKEFTCIKTVDNKVEK